MIELTVVISVVIFTISAEPSASVSAPLILLSSWGVSLVFECDECITLKMGGRQLMVPYIVARAALTVSIH